MEVRNHLFKEKLPLYNRALDAYALRQQVISRNIANATTPGYRPEEVKFEEELQKAKSGELHGARTDSKHFPFGPLQQGEVEGKTIDKAVPPAEVLFSGESHVNVDKEMSELAQNQIRFRFASRITSKYFQGLQNAIKGTNQ